jgi:hypothetical protein
MSNASIVVTRVVADCLVGAFCITHCQLEKIADPAFAIDDEHVGQAADAAWSVTTSLSCT